MVIGEGLVWDVGTVGEKVTEEVILDRLQQYANVKPALDEHHQDQILILLSLAAGKSTIKVGRELSLHTKSLFYVIKNFIPDLKYNHDEETGILTIEGIGYKCGK